MGQNVFNLEFFLTLNQFRGEVHFLGSQLNGPYLVGSQELDILEGLQPFQPRGNLDDHSILASNLQNAEGSNVTWLKLLGGKLKIQMFCTEQDQISHIKFDWCEIRGSVIRVVCLGLNEAIPGKGDFTFQEFHVIFNSGLGNFEMLNCWDAGVASRIQEEGSLTRNWVWHIVVGKLEQDQLLIPVILSCIDKGFEPVNISLVEPLDRI
ncbi:MAG: hypothetical protein ACK5RA_05210 [Cyanobacteriota bacterium]